MQRVSVVSIDLLSVGYNVANSTLEIEFQSGGLYQYSGVPVGEYNALMSASSKGGHFHARIKDRYSTRRIR